MKNKNQYKVKKRLSCGLAIGMAISGVVMPNPYMSDYVVHAQETQEKTIQDYLKKCWDERQTKIDLSSYDITSEELNSLIFKFHYENPEYYFILLDSEYEENTDGTLKTYYPKYPLDRSDELEAEWNIVQGKVKDCTTDLEKVLVVHDYLCETITYSEALGRSSHDIEGAILEKKSGM